MSLRTVRIGDLIAREVSLIIDRELKDPSVGFVTVTSAEVTEDLRFADVYVSVFGDEDKRKKSMEGLERASRFIKSLIGKRIRIRYTPEIRFRFDYSLIRGEQIDRLLKEIENE
jgi:ribosome-binding factor A